MSQFTAKQTELSPTEKRAMLAQLLQEKTVFPETSSPYSTSFQGMNFSFIYFAGNEAELGDRKYQLLLEGAKFADRHRFTAIWLPERHFHPFGGLYPSPSVLCSALAMVTERIRLRAGSVVMPLNSPLRVAEQWAIIDNLSGGRVDLAFARGWNANDFVLNPAAYENNRDALFTGIEQVQKLWRGESILVPNGVGDEVEIRTYPAPVQAELPVWVTCSGGKERFVEAGAAGAHVLTALLFQEIEELEEKIALYRAARADNGYDPQSGQVTLMLHTFIEDDLTTVRDRVRQPFMNYLRTSVNLWSRGKKNVSELSDRERDKLVEYAFERYFQTNALFGTPESVRPTIQRLHDIGINEIACLLDFGVEVESVLASLDSLNRLREQCVPAKTHS
ncbi:MAG: LLM class flavin-dependent oxidoreductase [Cyanobacteria bacterium J06642_2]